jgi:hypothetical protein
VPRTKYTKPPGPFPAIEQIERANFRFRNDQWRKLTELLPRKLASLSVPPADAAVLSGKVKTIADYVIQLTEEAVASYLTAKPLISEGRINPANARAAIRRLREALNPFVRGWVDYETAQIVPSDLDAKLAAREQELVKLRLPSVQQRALAKLCQQIEVYVRRFASANGETVSKQDIVSYVDTAMNFARIKHPNVSKHRNRLAALVFSRSQLPH